MIRSELIQKLADENPHLFQRDVERIVNTIFDEITETMARGDRVELRGFGAFSVKKRDSRIGRNPRTGASLAAAEERNLTSGSGNDDAKAIDCLRNGGSGGVATAEAAG